MASLRAITDISYGYRAKVSALFSTAVLIWLQFNPAAVMCIVLFKGEEVDIIRVGHTVLRISLSLDRIGTAPTFKAT